MVEFEAKPPYEKELRRVLGVVEKEAYQQGWRDGIAAVIEAARVVMERQSRPRQPGGPARRAKRGSVPSLVLRILEERRSATTTELIEQAQILEGAAPSSVRTALRRLLRNGKIEQHGDEWCLVGATKHDVEIDPFNDDETSESRATRLQQNATIEMEEEEDDEVPF